MKVKAEAFINSKRSINFDKILITGSDEAFVSYVKNHIIQDFKNRNYFIDFSNNYTTNSMGGLFSENKTLFVLSDFPTDMENDKTKMHGQCILVALLNGKKTNAIKPKLAKDKEGLVIECYSLNRSSKESTLKNYIKTKDLTLSGEVFWYIVDNLDNNYVIFIKQLQMLSLFNKKIDIIADIEKITFVDNKIEINKIFFNILKKNKILTNAFNKSINSLSDFYIFINSTKSYLEIIKNSEDSNSALFNFPKYLFAEKEAFLLIYKKLNKNKLTKIYRSISKVELIIRQNPNLYLVIGLRFFLNLKKIIIS